MSVVAKNKSIYFPELDGLRFIAFLAVYIHHAPLWKTNALWATLHNYGWMGVDLFFCLSAFLFTKLLFVEFQTKNDINIKNFYIRRALRIWPLYLFFIGAMLVLTLSTRGLKPDGWLALFLDPRMFGLLTFTDNIVTATFFKYNTLLMGISHLWTISYEEQFYAVIPWFLRKMFRSTTRIKTLALITILLLFSLIRALFIFTNVRHPAIWVLPITHFEAILGGLLIGLGLVDGILKKIDSRLLLAFGLGALFLVTRLPNANMIGWNLMLTYPLVGLGMTLILSALIAEEKWGIKKILQTRPLTYLGKISYGLYIYHLIAILYAEKATIALGILPKWGVANPLMSFLLGFIFTLILSMASYQWLEKPFLYLKAKFTSIETRPI